jgi:hypothetical protein
MKIYRSHNPARFIEIVEDPSIKDRHVAYGHDFPDLAALVKDKNNILLMVDNEGCFFLHYQEPGVYELHTSFLPIMRGKRGLIAAELASDWVFNNTDVSEIWTSVPAGNIAAKAGAIKGGFKYQHTLLKEWPTALGAVDVHRYRMTVNDWLQR